MPRPPLSLDILPSRHLRHPIGPGMNENLARVVVDGKGDDGFSTAGDCLQPGRHFVADRSPVWGLCPARDRPFDLGKRPIGSRRPRIIQDPSCDDVKVPCHERLKTNNGNCVFVVEANPDPQSPQQLGVLRGRPDFLDLEVHSCFIRREIEEIWTDSTAFAVD